MFKPSAVFFDLDGTLVDSVADMAFAVGKMLTHFDLPAPGIEQVSTWVGNGAQQLVKRADVVGLDRSCHGRNLAPPTAGIKARR